MAERVYMIPAPSVRVTHPAGSPKARRALPAEGEWVLLDDWWTRRELDGSCARGAPPNETAPAPVAGKGKG